jgi:GTPase SAR1 family protein
MDRWFNEVKSSANADLKVLLCGNKCDLSHKVSFEEAQKSASVKIG